MPRLPPHLVRRASHISPDLATLLPACRDLRSAANELRWLKEHADTTTRPDARPRRLTQLCQQRGRGVPLQYVLGTQPFGSLDIKCRPGVLVPRPETEAYVCHLVDLLKSGALLGQPASSCEKLRIIDFCTGTGCIPLLLFAELRKSVHSLDVRGVDISPRALELAQENLVHNIARGHMSPASQDLRVSFANSDVFSDKDNRALAASPWDVMISNPPYVAEEVWNHGRGQLGYSVRKYEPRLALVPGDHLPSAPSGLNPEDVFYARLLDIASILRPQVLLLEVGDSDQARRVVGYSRKHPFSMDSEVEIWRDWPDLEPNGDEEQSYRMPLGNGRGHEEVVIKGSGNIRSVLIHRP
ncbi:Mitochondrial N(5)-glutamine methyltransferase-like protein [Hapsidospora chrysogenum ATCC 11550]|uniref:peptide chain release factor N(5)-glutamine methyltransferase n=1 Tax=Hapsidospora chrysogenum (strain ATCC 11550 / CBS 779.69 / DSM 880 / IAM 14645 / JCM 23072 / IMI 49137) TaxID=857340 RepID=A0A086TE05_HAPC1|nr:Mitochondrial N(5)-glutamine methyltransferase-like protein [Hapsidospora chrysogenum ATCC 11550]